MNSLNIQPSDIDTGDNYVICFRRLGEFDNSDPYIETQRYVIFVEETNTFRSNNEVREKILPI